MILSSDFSTATICYDRKKWSNMLKVLKKENGNMSQRLYIHPNWHSSTNSTTIVKICCSVAQSWLTLCNPMDCSTPGFPVPSLSPRACSDSSPLSQRCHPNISSSVAPFSSCLQSFPASGFFSNVSSSHQLAKVLEFQLQHQSFQWIFRVDFL